MSSTRKFLRQCLLTLARSFGTNLIDCETGRPLGKAFVIGWRGRVHVIGLETAVRAVFLPQARITYWKQELGFTQHPPPDFPNVREQPPRS
ncbi:MAG: hypothetical protein M3Y86_13495 [Verrucomicrobiota bacterium]|nr:hypothetical protein [Verrucomicrobiota bacterium]